MSGGSPRPGASPHLRPMQRAPPYSGSRLVAFGSGALEQSLQLFQNPGEPEERGVRAQRFAVRPSRIPRPGLACRNVAEDPRLSADLRPFSDRMVALEARLSTD